MSLTWKLIVMYFKISTRSNLSILNRRKPNEGTLRKGRGSCRRRRGARAARSRARQCTRREGLARGRAGAWWSRSSRAIAATPPSPRSSDGGRRKQIWRGSRTEGLRTHLETLDTGGRLARMRARSEESGPSDFRYSFSVASNASRICENRSCRL